VVACCEVCICITKINVTECIDMLLEHLYPNIGSVDSACMKVCDIIAAYISGDRCALLATRSRA